MPAQEEKGYDMRGGTGRKDMGRKGLDQQIWRASFQPCCCGFTHPELELNLVKPSMKGSTMSFSCVASRVQTPGLLSRMV